MKTILVSMILAFVLAGCAGTGGTSTDTQALAVQYATAKIIAQSDSIDSAEVIEAAERFKARLDGSVEVPVGRLQEAALEWAEEQGLDAADKMLVMALMQRIDTTLAPDVESGLLDEEARVRLIEVLDWIIMAARVAA